MTRYLISFDDGAMTFPEEETPAVGEAAHQVVRAAQEAGPSEARLLETFQLQMLACVRRDGTPCGASRHWPCFEPLAS
jgi:hypothetical protein